MTLLNHPLEAPSICGPNNANIAAFVEVTSIIRSCDAMVEFLSHPDFEKTKSKPLYMCPGWSNHTYS
jgi:hypothetical protein